MSESERDIHGPEGDLATRTPPDGEPAVPDPYAHHAFGAGQDALDQIAARVVSMDLFADEEAIVVVQDPLDLFPLRVINDMAELPGPTLPL